MSAERIENGIALTVQATRAGNVAQLATCINQFLKLGATGDQLTRALSDCPVSMLTDAGFDLIVELHDGRRAVLSQLMDSISNPGLSKEVSCEASQTEGDQALAHSVGAPADKAEPSLFGAQA